MNLRVFVLIGVGRGMAENEEPYTCVRCGWSGLEPISRSGERVDSFQQQQLSEHGSGMGGYAGGRLGESSGMVYWSECPDCKAAVYTESQRERLKWDGRFAIGMLVFIGFIFFMMYLGYI